MEKANPEDSGDVHVLLRDGAFAGRTFSRRRCEVGWRLMVTGTSSRGLDFQVYRVRLWTGVRFIACVDVAAEAIEQRVLLPDTR